MTFASRNSKKVKGGVFIDIVSPCFMTKEKAREVEGLFSDSLDAIKKESLGFYYIVKNYENTSEVMKVAARTLNIPLTIICSDTPPWTGIDSVNWKRCLKEFAESSSNRRFILAKNCGHYVFVDNPSLVIGEIVRQYRKLTQL